MSVATLNLFASSSFQMPLVLFSDVLVVAGDPIVPVLEMSRQFRRVIKRLFSILTMFSLSLLQQ